MNDKPKKELNHEDYTLIFRQSEKEQNNRAQLYQLFKETPIPGINVLGQLGLYMNRMNLSRMLFINHIYKQIVETHGVVMEFGTFWGQNLAWFLNYRGIYEPFNHNRKIIGFDTFTGFPSVHPEKDGTGKLIKHGTFTTTENYENYLEKLLKYHESENPIDHLKKFELVKGDVTKTLPDYIERHQETVVSLAYFDLDIYEPTKKCLDLIIPRLTKGSIVAFDEVNYSEFPGETLALMETLGLRNQRLKRTPYSATASYLVIE
jgi:hypothetical protein